MPSGTPAPGDRYAISGALHGVGNEGSVWSTSVSGTYGMYLKFDATWLNPSYAYYHGSGFQLRCLSE